MTAAPRLSDDALVLLERVRAMGDLARNYKSVHMRNKLGWNKARLKAAEVELRMSPFAGQFRPRDRKQIPQRIRESVMSRDGWCCQVCGNPATHSAPLTIGHHPVPYSRGGSDHPSNLRTECAPCNFRLADEESPGPARLEALSPRTGGSDE